MKKPVLAIALLLLLSGCAHSPMPKIEHYPHSRSGTFIGAVKALLYHNHIDSNSVGCLVWKTEEVNAFQTGNMIVVTTGFLDAAPLGEGRDYIIDCIVAHELAHWKLHHIDKNNAVTLGVNVVLLVGQLVTGLPISHASHVLVPTVSSAYSRSQEKDADLLAVVLLKNLGVDDPAWKLIDSLEWSEKVDPSPKWHLWSTHPPMTDRIVNIREAYPGP